MVDANLQAGSYAYSFYGRWEINDPSLERLIDWYKESSATGLLAAYQ